VNPTPELFPKDIHNETLLANVHPRDWENPDPAARYDLVVLGGGTAGLVSAAGAAGLGARVALVERHFLGGDCLNFGCVPSKAILRSAAVLAEIRQASRFGVRASSDPEIDFESVMSRMREIRARISPTDSAPRFRDELGVDVFLGTGRFSNARSLAVADDTLHFRKAVIATGARPILPGIPGLAEAAPLTNETIFSLTELPRRIAILGGGPIGCELAQAFARFGSETHLIEQSSQFLEREDAEAAKTLEESLRSDGVAIWQESQMTRVEKKNDERHIRLEKSGETFDLTVDAILVAAGRAPNVENLGLEDAGVEYSRHGVTVDDRLRTTNRRIFAAGDVCMEQKFTHAADFAARTVIQNALFFGRKKLSALTIPWCTYTDPEIAHVGLSESEARTKGIAIDSFTRSFAEVDRALTDGEESGFVKIHVAKGGDRIVGAVIVARHAGDLIGEISLAMAAGAGLARLANVIHPYPTRAEAIRQCGDAYNRTRLTPRTKRLFERFFGIFR